jgi:NAD(P)-dependent dehydrogenase (short-subunit alcohol dehydrogenase family)
MKTIEKIEIMEKTLNLYLGKILAHICKFLKIYKEKPNSMENILNALYLHPISKSKKKIEKFLSIIEKAELNYKEKIIDIKEASDMKKKRIDELGQINNFIDFNYEKLLTQINKSEKNLLLPSQIEINEIDEIKDDDFDKKRSVLKKLRETKKLLKKKRKLEKIKNKEIKEKFKNFSKCYICKENFTLDNIHKFYGNLCTKCGDHNYSYRTLQLDLSGRIAIVTGGRVKIGYYISTKLLSYGCKVIITTRFPKDSLLKYQQDPDYEKWKDNLIIYPIDFRIFESTIKFINYIKENFTHIDILINNAAQTLRRTSTYYNYLLPIETKEVNKENDKKIVKEDYVSIQNSNPKILDNKPEILNSLIPSENKKNFEFQEILPLSVIASQIKIMEEKYQPSVTMMGSDGQPYDFAGGKNSWNFEFDEIPFQEFTEVQIINAWTPYYLCAKLKPLMEKSPFQDKYIVNVTAVEGMFNHYKRTTHVHTNMAKAALNMFTRTCGKYLKNIGIYMTCVDTGWVNYMDEMTKLIDENEKELFENKFTNIPLDELDGAMRVLQPIIEGIKNKNYLYGILLKNYTTSVW